MTDAIDLNKISVFTSHLSTLKETSKDDSGKENQYMISSDLNVINFDAVKKDYVVGLKMSKMPMSIDALFDDGKGKLLFVEFKNGRIDHKKQRDLQKKVYDSILIFTDLTSTSISYMRGHMEFIFVYNDCKNQHNTTDTELMEKNNEVQPSKSYTRIVKNLAKQAKKEYICFGMRAFKNYCFKDVHTFTENEFENYLSELGLSINESVSHCLRE